MSKSLGAAVAIIRVMLPVLFGFLMQVFGVFGEQEENVLRRLVVKFNVPLMIFYSMYTADVSNFAQVMPMTGAFLALTVGMVTVAYVSARALHLNGAARRAFVLCIAFGNYGWIGWAVSEAFFGQAGLNMAIFFTLFWWPIFYPVGALIGADGNLRSLSRDMVRKLATAMVPTLVAVAVGMALNLSGWQLPSPLDKTVSDFSSMTVPLILFSVGLQLRLDRLGALYKKGLLITGIRFVFGALIAFAVSRIFRVDPVSAGVIRVEGVMPVATVIPVLYEYFEIDRDLVTAAIVVSTLLSIVLLPIWARVLV